MSSQPLPLTKKIMLVSLGFLFAFIIIEASLHTAGFLNAPATPLNKTQTDGTIKILCLGESTTARGGKDSWPAQLEVILNNNPPPDTTTVKIFNCAREGIMSSEILAELENNLAECRPQIVIAMMGINDDADFVKIRHSLPSWARKLKTVKLASILSARIKQKINEYKFFKEEQKTKSPLPDSDNFKNNKTTKNLLIEGEDENRNNNYKAALKLYAQAAALAPDNKEPYILSGDCLLRKGDFEEAANMYLAAVRLAPTDEQPLVAIGHCRMKQGRYKKAAQFYEKALAINPDEHYAYERLAACYRKTGDFDSVRKVYERGQTRHLKNADLALEYFKSETTRGTGTNEREQILHTAMQRFPGDYRPWAQAGFLYMDEIKDFARAQKFFEHALKLNAEEKHFIYLCLADICNVRQDTDKLKHYIEKMEELVHLADTNSPEEESKVERISSYLALYFKDKDKKKSGHYYARAKAMRSTYISAMTKTNYNRLYKILKNHSVKLVAVQYPMRPIERLKNIFGDSADILFVDNEKSFKKKIKADSYESCFTDHFAGDFGHATRDGNRLIAQNIAKKLKESLLSP